MNTAPKQYNIAIVLGVLLVCLAGVCAYQYLASVAAVRAIAEQHEALVSAHKKAAALASAQADEKQMLAKISRHPASWSWTEQLPVMVSQLTGVEQGCGAPIDTLQPSPMVTRGQLARFPLHLTLQMDLASLTKFLQRAQRAVPVLAVDQLTIHAGKKTGDPLHVDLTLSSYVMLEGSQKTGGRL